MTMTSHEASTSPHIGLMDGEALARQIRGELRHRVDALVEVTDRPGLGTILVGNNPGSRSYVAGKHRDCAEIGIESIRIDLPIDATLSMVEDAVDQLNADERCTSFIVQLPLPDHVDMRSILDRIDPDKDADGLHPANLGRLVLGIPGTLPCTPRGILELLRHHDVPITGAQVCIVGCGVTVGRPLGLMLTRSTEHATVTLCHEATVDIATHTQSADVIVAAAGVAHVVRPDWVKPGATVLSVGISRTAEGILGDVHPDVEDVAGRWTRVKGGVGPMTRAMLMTNVVEQAERNAARVPGTTRTTHPTKGNTHD